MTINGHTTCPHCKAIVQSTTCTICGKSAFDEVVVTAPQMPPKWWQLIDHRSVTRKAALIVGVLLLGGATAYVVTRPEPPPDPTALPPPSANTNVTTTTRANPGRSPSVDRGDMSDRGALPGLDDVGVDREIGLGLSPWEAAPPVDFVTGRLLDLDLDFEADIARVAGLIEAFPAMLTLDPVDATELLTFGGPVNLDITEQTQPFAARKISNQDDAVGELWLMVSGGTEAGDAYLATARARWASSLAVDRFAPRPGLRIWKLGEDSTTEMWVGDLSAYALVIVQAPVGIDPAVITSVIEAWRDNLQR